MLTNLTSFLEKQYPIILLVGIATIGVGWYIKRNFLKKRNHCGTPYKGSRKKINPWKNSKATELRKFYCGCPRETLCQSCSKSTCCCIQEKVTEKYKKYQEQLSKL